jgi:hypothetical protein
MVGVGGSNPLGRTNLPPQQQPNPTSSMHTPLPYNLPINDMFAGAK